MLTLMPEWILTSCVLILIVLLLRRLLTGRVDPRLCYALWGLVLLRLLLPISLFGSPASVLNAVAPRTEAVRTSLETVKVPTTIVRDSELTIDEVQAAYPNAGTLGRVEGYPVTSEKGELHTYTFTKPLSEFLSRILLWVWIAGMAVTGGTLLVSNLTFGLRLRQSRKPFDCDCALPVYLTAAAETPCLFGLWHPAIYLPPEAADLDEAQLRHILIHEETHKRHLDHLWAFGRCVCLTLHWYNPLVWLAARVSQRDCELACDASAMAQLGETAEYGRTLIALSCASPNRALLRTATMMTGGKGTLKERVRLIAKRPRLTALAAVLVAAIAIAAAAVTFSGRVNTAELPAELQQAAELAAGKDVLLARAQLPANQATLSSWSTAYGAEVSEFLQSKGFRRGLKATASPGEAYEARKYELSETHQNDEFVEFVCDYSSNVRLTLYRKLDTYSYLAKYTNGTESVIRWYKISQNAYQKAASFYGKPEISYRNLWPDPDLSIVHSFAAARLEKRDGESILVTSVMDFASLPHMTFAVYPGAAQPAADWVYRLTFDPSDVVQGKEEFVVLAGEDFLTVNGTVCGPAQEDPNNSEPYRLRWKELLDWFDGKYAYLTGDRTGLEADMQSGSETSIHQLEPLTSIVTRLAEDERPTVSRLFLAEMGLSSTVELDTADFFSWLRARLEQNYALTELVMPPPNPSSYSVTVTLGMQTNGFEELTFYEDGAGGLVQYSNGTTSRYWQVQQGEYPYPGFASLAKHVRYYHDSRALDPVGISFSCEDDALARFCREMYPEFFLQRAVPGSMFEVRSITAYSYELIGMKTDPPENYLFCSAAWVVDPVEVNTIAWAAGSGLESAPGPYAGKYLLSRTFVLRQNEAGQWTCLEMGSGGNSFGIEPTPLFSVFCGDGFACDYEITGRTLWDGERWVSIIYDRPDPFGELQVLTLKDAYFLLISGRNVIRYSGVITNTQGQVIYSGGDVDQIQGDPAYGVELVDTYFPDGPNVYELAPGDYTFTIRFTHRTAYFPDADGWGEEECMTKFILRVPEGLELHYVGHD